MSNVSLNFLDRVAAYHQIGNVRPSVNVSVPTGLAIPSFPSGQVHIIASDAETVRALDAQDKEKRKNERETNAAMIGGLVTLIFSGLSALGLRHYTNLQKELKAAEEFKKNNALILTEGEALTDIANKHIEILQSEKFFARNILILTGLALGSAIAAFAGGMFSVPMLITAGIVAGLATTAIGIFGATWHYTDDSIAMTESMKKNVETLRAQLARN